MSQWNPLNHGKCLAEKFQTCKLIDVVTVRCKFSLEFWVLWHNNIPINSFVKERKFHGIKITWLWFYFVCFFFQNNHGQASAIWKWLCFVGFSHSADKVTVMSLSQSQATRLYWTWFQKWWEIMVYFWNANVNITLPSVFHCACMSDTQTQHSWWTSV